MKTCVLKVEQKEFIFTFEDIGEAKWHMYNIVDWACRVFDTNKVKFSYVKAIERNKYKNAKPLSYEEVALHYKFLLHQSKNKEKAIKENKEKNIKIICVVAKETYFIEKGNLLLSTGETIPTYDLRTKKRIVQRYTFKNDAYNELKKKAIKLANAKIIMNDGSIIK